MRVLAKFLFHKVFRWKFDGKFPRDLDQYVAIVAPHTSNWDFPIGLFTRYIQNEKISFVGKKSLFKPPHGFFFKSIGGIALDRSGGLNKVDAMAALFEKYDNFKLQIAPEGTRSKVKEWKTGFYYIAMKAGVPIVPIAFDYSTKTVAFFPTFYPTGNIEIDLPKIKSYFNERMGLK